MTSRRHCLEGLTASKSFHAGLWLDKFLFDSALGGEANTAHLQAVEKTILIPDGYEDWCEVRQTSFAKVPNIKCFTAKVGGRMVVGLGQKGVLEVGIRLDRTWGVPVIPGSSLKGIAALTARQTGQPEWGESGASYLALFGGPDANGDDERGAVVFYDAYWKPSGNQLPLHLDVMTVHHPEYYQSSGATPPSDTDSPTPISFLSATGSYEFFLEGPATWVEAAFELLKRGLAEHGIGGKTAGGYGRFADFKDTTQELKREWQEQQETREKEQAEAEEATLPLEDRAKKMFERNMKAMSFGEALNAVTALEGDSQKLSRDFWVWLKNWLVADGKWVLEGNPAKNKNINRCKGIEKRINE